MNFKLGKIVSYIKKSGVDFKTAAEDFFGNNEIYPEMPAFENISALFNEWLIFDYKLPSGSTIISEYYSKNPDGLSNQLMNELNQIIQTNIYDLFEVEKVDPGISVTVWGLFSGKRYEVLEISLSLSLGKRKGCFVNRIAKIDGNYYFIGSNPAFLPVTHTERSIKIFKTENNEAISPKLALTFFLPPKDKPQKIIVTKKEIIHMRKKLQKQFEKLKQAYSFLTTFDNLKNFLFNETYKDHFADFYKDVLIIGITEKVIVENMQFFQDFWNYFPHKKLNGESPADQYRKVYG